MIQIFNVGRENNLPLRRYALHFVVEAKKVLSL